MAGRRNKRQRVHPPTPVTEPPPPPPTPKRTPAAPLGRPGTGRFAEIMNGPPPGPPPGTTEDSTGTVDASTPEADSVPVAGPMTGPAGLRQRYAGVFDPHFADEITAGLTPKQIEDHQPVMRLEPYDPKALRPLTAAEITARRSGRGGVGAGIPTMYANPMQSVDYIVYEQLLKSTFVGPLHQALMRFVFGRGFTPKLRLANADAAPDEEAAIIEQYRPVIDTLLQIDRNIDRRMGGPSKTFKDLMQSAITAMLAYNRSCLVFGWDVDDANGGQRIGQVINGRPVPEIPNYLVFAHPRDIGLIEVGPHDRQITKVQWRNGMMDMTPVSEMIYLWNKPMSQDSYNSEYYSTSMLTPLVPLAKIIRKGVHETIPAQQDLSWMGRFLVIAKNEGGTQATKMAEWQQLAQRCVPGQPNILIKSPDDVAVHPLPADAQILPLAEILQMCIKVAISCLGLPQVAFYDESAANRATMVGKIQLTHRTTIEPMREWIGQMICDQWYTRWFNLLYPELADTLEVHLEWTNLHISEWYDAIQAALELDGRQQLRNSDFGKLAGIEGYEAMLEPDALTAPGGDPARLTLADARTGQEFELRQRRQAINQMRDQAAFMPQPDEGGGGGGEKKEGKKKEGGKKK